MVMLPAIVVGQGILGYPVEPAGEWPAAVLITPDTPQRIDEDLRRYVLGGRGVIETSVKVAVNLVNVAVVEETEAVGLNLRPLDEEAFIVVHGGSLDPRWAGVITECSVSVGGKSG